MKTITMMSTVLCLAGATLAVAQVKAPVIVAGGSPAAPLPTISQQFNGDIAISYGGSFVNQNITIPGRPPSRVFTNELGEIGIIWGPATPQQPVTVAPQLPTQPLVVSAPNPLAHYITNQDGSIVIYWR